MPIAALDGPAAWRRVDLLSDVHLQASDPETFSAWRRYMEEATADAVFLLGDIFEAWIGDDAAAESGSFESECAAVLRRTAARRPVFFQHGNRDFLVGEDFLGGLGAALLEDPCVLRFGGKAWLLSHGDALCTDDAPYMAFRARTRAPAWQAEFLAQPLAARRDVARTMRAQSESRRQAEGGYGDIDPGAAQRWLRSAQARVMVHGHTHRPAEHALADGMERIVLSDWDLRARPPRAEVLEIDRSGAHRRRAVA
ncbi:MAG: UDP-2,3-diacylglucosamine diphosphatase [Xylophilus ampelinus]